MNYSSRILLDEVLRVYDSIRPHHQMVEQPLSESDMWKEICFCILSSNVPFDLALSAVTHLKNNKLLEPHLIENGIVTSSQLASELSKNKFLPLKKDGTMRKYRFPYIRSENIVSSSRIIYIEGDGLVPLIESFESESRLRNYLAKSIPGLGLKQSSMFLRNIGYSHELAIIDTHIIRFLMNLLEFPNKRPSTISNKLYFQIENILNELCTSLDLDLSVFDLAVWHYMRGN